jgi:hypothetical protein
LVATKTVISTIATFISISCEIVDLAYSLTISVCVTIKYSIKLDLF